MLPHYRFVVVLCCCLVVVVAGGGGAAAVAAAVLRCWLAVCLSICLNVLCSLIRRLVVVVAVVVVTVYVVGGSLTVFKLQALGLKASMLTSCRAVWPLTVFRLQRSSGFRA